MTTRSTPRQPADQPEPLTEADDMTRVDFACHPSEPLKIQVINLLIPWWSEPGPQVLAASRATKQDARGAQPTPKEARHERSSQGDAA